MSIYELQLYKILSIKNVFHLIGIININLQAQVVSFLMNLYICQTALFVFSVCPRFLSSSFEN